MTTRGFLLGKFLPPHKGHVLMCDFARAWADEVTVLVCSLEHDPVPGVLRYEWMRELAPACRVVHFDRDVPQEPSEHEDFWAIWRAVVREVHPEPIDFVFASEPYGEPLADEVGARFVPVDFARAMVPAEGHTIIADPLGHWHHLPAPVRPFFLKKVSLFGPESTGKSALSSQLADRFHTTYVPEYARLYTRIYGTNCDHGDLAAIARGQAASQEAAARTANKVVFWDTDPVLTRVWSQMLVGSCGPELDHVDCEADLYLLLDTDLPYEDDGTRYFPDLADRRRFFELCRDELQRRGAEFVVISGDWDARFEQAVSAVGRAFPGLTACRGEKV